MKVRITFSVAELTTCFSASGTVFASKEFVIWPTINAVRTNPINVHTIVNNLPRIVLAVMSPYLESNTV